MSCAGFPSACDLNVVIEIQRSGAVEDSLAGRAKSWTTIEPTWCKWEDNGGGEGGYAGGRRSTTSHTIYVRFTDLRASDRIKRGSVIYNIDYVTNVKQRNVWLKVGLQEGVPA